jgi:hypothetical protein
LNIRGNGSLRRETSRKASSGRITLSPFSKCACAEPGHSRKGLVVGERRKGVGAGEGWHMFVRSRAKEAVEDATVEEKASVRS